MYNKEVETMDGLWVIRKLSPSKDGEARSLVMGIVPGDIRSDACTNSEAPGECLDEFVFGQIMFLVESARGHTNESSNQLHIDLLMQLRKFAAIAFGIDGG
jgi:hypothetical protein